MRVDLFNFELPDERIALRPAVPRDSAKMLVVGDVLEDRHVSDLANLLKPGDALVFNDTRVIPAQLTGVRRRGDAEADVSATLHTRLTASNWLCFAKGSKKLKAGDRIVFGEELACEVMEKRDDGNIELFFDQSGAQFDEALARSGAMPLPPYIAGKRGTDEQDQEDYQTIYAREDGAVAAPTAGLHFTPRLMEALEVAGIYRHFVTLHVGPGTFLPMKADDTRDHRMHSEWGRVSDETAKALNHVRKSGGRIICVGTTSLRLLESSVEEDGTFRAWEGATDIFITPGFRFRAADILMTNFHLPKSTLFMLVSAFCGLDVMQAAYAHAINHNYRFYSYGDSSLLYRKT